MKKRDGLSVVGLLLISFFIIKVPHFFVMAIITAFLDMLPILGTGTILIPYILIEDISYQFLQTYHLPNQK